MSPQAKRQRSGAAKKGKGKSTVHVDRQRSKPPESEKQSEPKSESVEGVEETRLLTPEERAAQEHALRDEHNRRTGGGPVREGELQAQREEHNRRTGGS